MSVHFGSGGPAAVPMAVTVAGIVVAIAWPRRPRSRRQLPRRDDPTVIPPADDGEAPAVAREMTLREARLVPLSHSASANLVAPLGRWLRRAARRPPDPGADRRLGVVVVAGGAAGLLVTPWLGFAVAGAVAGAQRWRRHRSSAIAERQIADALPDVVDLLRVAVSAGCTVPVALAAVARRAPPAIGPALREALRQHALGMSLADALDGVIRMHGDVVRPVVQVLVAADRDGALLGPALERLATDLRTDRRRRADIAARRLPIAMLFPLVLCTLPAFGLLTIAPLLLTTLQALHH